MSDLDKRMHFCCGACKTNFSTGEVFPIDVKKLTKLVRETKCPTCGVGSKNLFLRASMNVEENNDR